MKKILFTIAIVMLALSVLSGCAPCGKKSADTAYAGCCGHKQACASACKGEKAADCTKKCEGKKAADCAKKCEGRKAADCAKKCEGEKKAECKGHKHDQKACCGHADAAACCAKEAPEAKAN